MGCFRHFKHQSALIFCLVLAVALVPRAIAQQSTNAQITGIVTDSTGASVPEVSLKATNTATNVEFSTVSNEAGVYVLPQLVPGPYQITVSKEGFQTLVRSEITLRIGDRATINFELKPGEIQTTVDVTATAEILTTDDATYSTTLDNAMITALPQLSRETLDLTRVTPGVQGEGPHKINEGATYQVGVAGTSYSLAGGQRNGTAITVDGTMVQDAEINNVNRAVPSRDAVGEFKVQTGVLTADTGRYSGGVITISSQSGTNDYHGRLFYYGRNHNLNSNSWQNNSLGVEKQPFHQHNYGLAVGGPLTIPKVIQGKDKTFFFFAWEGERYSSSELKIRSVPTPDEKRGDFSKSIINQVGGQPVFARVFDMFDGVTDAQGNFVRPEYPGATIPQNKQVALWPFYASLWPNPNHAPDANTTALNNYHALVSITRPSDRQTFRLDHNFNEHHRLHARASHYRQNYINPPPFLHASGDRTYDNNWQFSLNYNWIPSPTSVFEMRLGGSVAKLNIYQGSDGDPAIDTDRWPFDPVLFSGGLRSDSSVPPGLGVCPSDLVCYTTVGGGFYDQFTNQVYNANFSYSKIWNRHTLKVGYQHYFSSSIEQGGDLSGAVSVNPAGGSNQFWDNNDGLTGHALAEVMLGSAVFNNWGNFLISPNNQGQSAYVMDDWKVNTKLTLQLGLRYDHDNGRRHRYQYGSIYDIDAKNVLTPNAGWSWDQVTGAVPEAANFPQPAWVTEGVNGRQALINTPEYPRKTLFDSPWGFLQPRVGVSYALNDKTVLHGSYGLIYQSYTGLQTEYGGSFYYGTDTFTQLATRDGQQWVSEFGLDHGLGNFPLLPDGGRLGYNKPITDNAGYFNLTYGTCSSPTFGLCYAAPLEYKSPYEHAWGFSVQREIGTAWTASVEYQGIRGVNLITPLVGIYQYTNIDPKYYPLGNGLFEPVANPFTDQSQAFSGQTTVPLYQLLSGAPQYTGAGPGFLSEGKSFSNFVNFQIQARSYHGLSLLASYSIRKTLVNNVGKDPRQRGLPGGGRVFQNPNDLDEMYGVALYEMPQNLLLNYYYELPVGRGKKWMGNPQSWGGKIADAVLGGWGFAGVTNYWAKGTPLLGPTVNGSVTAPGAGVRWSVNGSGYKNENVDYQRALVVQGSFTDSDPSSAGVFNREAFVRTPDFSFGNVPIAFPDVRTPGGMTTDATLLKNFYLSDNRQWYLNVRLEALNFFNHPLYGAVERDPDSPTFGGILGKTGSRVMQIGLRLFF
jgi:Carboxypeptidase regulatory-like domain